LPGASPHERLPMTERIGWLDCTSGVSGDMLLGALADVGALDGLPDVLASVPELHATVTVSTTARGALSARRAVVECADRQPPHRTRQDVQQVIDAMHLPDDVRTAAAHVFDRLANAEARVHGIDPAAVQFHEVGAVDAIVDIIGVCLGLHELRLHRLTVSPVALGSGTTDTQHGPVPVPGPAVLALLQETSLIATGGGDDERATPTGVALLAELADDTSSMPPMRVDRVGLGAGGRDPVDRPNVVRLVVGDASGVGDAWLLVEANVDDLDPRLWPGVLDTLLASGAADAWLTPIVMKKGRPAHTVSALTTADRVDDVRRVLFVETSTIGARTTPVDKTALNRDWVEVVVAGQRVRVKVARLDGAAVSVNPEWDDVSAAATATGRAAKDVLADATSAARQLLG
jgi:pyridinium-3,5-bisthiocarboxylic acid mononucleotide nickel chelatase